MSKRYLDSSWNQETQDRESQMNLIESSFRNEAQRQLNEKILEQNAEYDAELNAQKAKFDKQIAEEREAEIKRLKKQRNEQFEESLRHEFFEANPDAYESDFQKILPQLRENHQLTQMESQNSDFADFYSKM